MRALTFEVDGDGVRLAKSIVAPGRVKAPPLSSAPHRLEFEVYDSSGNMVYAGPSSTRRAECSRASTKLVSSSGANLR